MPIRRVKAHDSVVNNSNALALERGPLVYCIEAVDHGGRVHDLFLPEDAPLVASFKQKFLGGVTVIRGQAMRVFRKDDSSVATSAVDFRAIPYFAWAHREIGEMAVWIPANENAVPIPPLPTIASTSDVTASHTWDTDTVHSMNDQIDPKNSSDHDAPRHTWWNHKGTTEWAQYSFSNQSTISTIEVYWFDDSGRGSCRVPDSWRLLYRSGNRWKPVEATTDYLVAKDKFNKLKFKSVTTDALRLEVQLKKEFSGGILEWRVH